MDVIPNLKPSDIFDINTDNSYEGPPLPLKYQDILLESDWYIPGKALRKNRKHRASHGKIR